MRDSRSLQDIQGDLLEFVPTHMVFSSLERSGSLVMELGRTANGQVRIQYPDGDRSVVSPVHLHPLPEEK